jgi:PleD family two-component response regulator
LKKSENDIENKEDGEWDKTIKSLEGVIDNEIDEKRENKNFEITILVIDDDYLNIRVVENFLKNKYKIFYATNGKDGLEILEKERIDVICWINDAGFIRFMMTEK